MNILALMAHADDAAFFCAGTLAKYKAAGHNIYIAVATGTEEPWGAKELGAEIRLLGFGEGTVQDDMIARPAVLTAMRWADADVIITHAPWDADGEHAMVSKLAIDSLLIVGGKLHPADLPPIDKQPHLFYVDTKAGSVLENRYTQKNAKTNDQTFYLTPGVYTNDWAEPEAYTDITDFAEQKLATLQKDERLAALAKAQSRLRGMQMGVTYAEAFSGLRMNGHIADYRLLP